MTAPRLVPLTALLAAALAASAAGLAGQAPDTATVAPGPRATARADTAGADGRPTPGGAFLRAVALPGWGHASIGSYTRGGFYFGVETATAFMVVRNLRRKGAAEDARDLVEALRAAELLREGASPDSVPGLLDEDEGVEDARELVEARGQQVEDWAALGIFLVLLSGADAFVSAHLADFPEPVTVQAAVVPGARGARVEVGARLFLGPGGGRCRGAGASATSPGGATP